MNITLHMDKMYKVNLAVLIKMFGSNMKYVLQAEIIEHYFLVFGFSRICFILELLEKLCSFTV